MGVDILYIKQKQRILSTHETCSVIIYTLNNCNETLCCSIILDQVMIATVGLLSKTKASLADYHFPLLL